MNSAAEEEKLSRITNHYRLTPLGGSSTFSPRSRGAIAQLGERLHGMQEVGGSIPPSSTKQNSFNVAFVYRLGLQVFILARGVRFPYAMPFFLIKKGQF